jgi:hypothetical protein
MNLYYLGEKTNMANTFEKHKDRRIKEIHKRVLNFHKKKKN